MSDSEEEFMAEIDAMTARGELESMLTKNISATDHCDRCHDTGWVDLERRVSELGCTYSEWSAPCVFCEEGEAVATCQRSGIDRRHGAGKPAIQPWRGKQVDTTYQTVETIPTHCARCGPRPVTFDDYLGTERGQQDTDAALLREMLADRATRTRARVGLARFGHPHTPVGPVEPGTRRPSPATGTGRFAAAAAAADSIGGDPEPQEEP